MKGYLMRFLKKYALTLVVASLALQPSQVSGMERIQKVIDGIANSSPWARFCDFLVEIGQDVVSCDQYRSHTYEELYTPTSAQRMLLSIMQLAGQICPKVAAPAVAATTKTMHKHDVHFPSGDGNIIECSLYKNLALTCCEKNNIAPCSSFNILDNNNPFHNCCITDTNGSTTCSTILCNDVKSTEALCNMINLLKQKNLMAMSNRHKVLLKELSDKSVEESSQTPELDICIRKIEDSFNLHPVRRIKKIEVYNTSEARYSISPLWNDTSIYLSLSELFPKECVIGHEIAHAYQFECAHGIAPGDFYSADADSPIKQVEDRPNGPGNELDADILGSLAALDVNDDNIIKLAAGWLGEHIVEGLHDQNPTNYIEPKQLSLQDICSANLPIIDQTNVDTFKNVKRTDVPNKPHPKSIVRATMLFKLAPMIKAYLQFVDSTVKTLPSAQINSTQINASNT